MTLPAKYDLTYGVRKWGMLGNGRYGDCYEAAFEHLRMSKAMSGKSPIHKALYRVGFRPPHTPYTEEIYFDYEHATGATGPAPDLGTNASNFWPWAVEHKLALGAASVDITPSNPNWQADMRQAMVDFGGGVLSVNLNKDIWKQFYSNTLALDVNPGTQPPVPNIGGHAVAHLRYGPAFDVYITWGRPKFATLNWTEYSRIDYWVCVTPEDLLNPRFDVKGALAKIATMQNGIVAPGFA